MTMAANRHLRAVGEMDAFAVMETAEKLFPEYPTKEKISEHMRLWAENLKTQKGVLSIDATAAKFLQAADHLLQILDQTPEVQVAAFAFADAWHWWHLELYGEHALAANAHTAERAVAGLKAGPEALKRSRALREAVIEVEYDKYAKTADAIDRGSPKRAAGAILKAVAAVFSQQELGLVRVDLPLNFHPAAIRVSADFTPSGAGRATCDRRSWSGLRSRSHVAVRLAA
jgi:hypothetical protein